MLAFGVGTLPNLLLAGLLAARLQAYAMKPGVRVACGLLILGFGVWGLLGVLGLAQQVLADERLAPMTAAQRGAAMSDPGGAAVDLDLPVSGMSCAACATRIEKVLNRLPGVSASVNLATEHALVSIAGEATTPQQIVAAIGKAGFSVPPQTLELAIAGMSCAACSTRLEKMLNRLPGVDAVVNLASERATVRYLPGVVAPALLIATIERAGFTGRLADDRSQADEKAAKIASERAELRRFWISAAADAAAGRANADHVRWRAHAHQDFLPRWLQLLLATPVQFWIGWRFTMAPGRPCAVAVPTWTCWSRSAPAWLTASAWSSPCRVLPACMSISRPRRQ
jgi:copper ion binding protein